MSLHASCYGRFDWAATLARAAEFVRSYNTGVTLRQLFYRLVAAGLLENTQNAYKAAVQPYRPSPPAGPLPGTPRPHPQHSPSCHLRRRAGRPRLAVGDLPP